MNNDITQLLIIALAIVPFVNGLVGLVKKSFPKLQSNFTPIIAVISGVILGTLFAFLPDTNYTLVQMITAGVIAGMASCGVYEIAKSPDVTGLTSAGTVTALDTLPDKIKNTVSPASAASPVVTSLASTSAPTDAANSATTTAPSQN